MIPSTSYDHLVERGYLSTGRIRLRSFKKMVVYAKSSLAPQRGKWWYVPPLPVMWGYARVPPLPLNSELSDFVLYLNDLNLYRSDLILYLSCFLERFRSNPSFAGYFLERFRSNFRFERASGRKHAQRTKLYHSMQ